VTALIWSPQALADVEEIRAYIALDSRSHADLTAQRIMAAVERLKTFPDSGRMHAADGADEIERAAADAFAHASARGGADGAGDPGWIAWPRGTRRPAAPARRSKAAIFCESRG